MISRGCAAIWTLAAGAGTVAVPVRPCLPPLGPGVTPDAWAACSPVARGGELRAAHDLGITAAELEALAGVDERARSYRALGGLATRTGLPRAGRLGACGQLRAALGDGGRVWAQPWRCRDRACPVCMASRSRRLAWRLRVAAMGRALVTPDLDRAFVTLTQRKRPSESAREALDRLIGAWRRLTRSRAWRGVVAGAVRAIELTWSGAGGRGGHRPDADGWHAHAHVLVELAPGVRTVDAWPAIRAAWLELADAEAPGQDCRELDETRIGQLAKYVVKPFAIEHLGRAAEAFGALSGRRMLDGTGTWRGWQRWLAGLEARPEVRLSDSTIGKIRRYAQPWSLDGGQAFRRGPGDRHPIHLRSRDVWAALVADAERRHVVGGPLADELEADAEAARSRILELAAEAVGARLAHARAPSPESAARAMAAAMAARAEADAARERARDGPLAPRRDGGGQPGPHVVEHVAP